MRDGDTARPVGVECGVTSPLQYELSKGGVDWAVQLLDLEGFQNNPNVNSSIVVCF